MLQPAADGEMKSARQRIETCSDTEVLPSDQNSTTTSREPPGDQSSTTTSREPPGDQISATAIIRPPRGDTDLQEERGKELYRRLTLVDPESARRIHPKDTRKLAR